jgi:hypothetical protein
MTMNPLKYQPMKPNEAQSLLVSMGLDDLRLLAHHGGKRGSFTKKGPGRKPGAPKRPDVDARPITQDDVMARPGLFVGQHTNLDRSERRRAIERVGIRQYKRSSQRHRPEFQIPF